MGGVVDQMENVSKSDDSENRKLVKKNEHLMYNYSNYNEISGNLIFDIFSI